MTGRCPFCASTDIAELADEDRLACLDCDRTWRHRGAHPIKTPRADEK